jgi:hypothetical protein
MVQSIKFSSGNRLMGIWGNRSIRALGRGGIGELGHLFSVMSVIT